MKRRTRPMPAYKARAKRCREQQDARTLSQTQLCELFRQAGFEVGEDEPVPVVRRYCPKKGACNA